MQCCAQVAILKFKSSAVIRFEQHGTDYEPVNSCAATGLDTKKKVARTPMVARRPMKAMKAMKATKHVPAFPGADRLMKRAAKEPTPQDLNTSCFCKCLLLMFFITPTPHCNRRKNDNLERVAFEKHITNQSIPDTSRHSF